MPNNNNHSNPTGDSRATGNTNRVGAPNPRITYYPTPRPLTTSNPDGVATQIGAMGDTNNGAAYDPALRDVVTGDSLYRMLGGGGSYGGYAGAGGVVSGGGSGGGGGSAGPSQADMTSYMDAMRKLIGTMGGPAVGGVNRMAEADIRNPYADVTSALSGMVNPLTGMIDPAVDKDIAAARAAFGDVAAGVSMEDPYANMQVQAAQVDPALANFAERQGISPEYAAQVELSNADAQNTAANWQGLQQALGANHVAGQQQIIDASNQQAALVEAGFEGQRTNLQAAAAAQQLAMDREAAQDQQQIDLAGRQFDATLAEQIAAYQMQLDAERRQSETSGNDQRLAALMELLNTGFQFGNVPSLEGLI